MDGMREEATAFAHDISARRAPQLIGTPFEGLRRYRRFGDIGPMYEVLSMSADTVHIHVIDNGEELDYRIDRALADPVAT